MIGLVCRTGTHGKERSIKYYRKMFHFSQNPSQLQNLNTEPRNEDTKTMHKADLKGNNALM